ncbi:hypothetical protein GT034_20940 [Streptomyces sp. SID2563]|uniref:hypothetical protein n=1 Tax=Streptomyces sp. SID2563 TaxID=2690255 RepID=UPI00136B289A|nr:hypothetical protein [Streptomyces sp. SID2563]MYW10793.1 hypothetical protein [Streptomyces sp. SID2563]
MITILVVIVLVSPSWAKIVGAYTDAGAFLAMVGAVCGTAAKYRNRINHWRTVMSSQGFEVARITDNA